MKKISEKEAACKAVLTLRFLAGSRDFWENDDFWAKRHSAAIRLGEAFGLLRTPNYYQALDLACDYLGAE